MPPDARKAKDLKFQIAECGERGRCGVLEPCNSAFELEVLGWVADDYEAPHTITGDIARETGRSTTEAEVRAALLALAQTPQWNLCQALFVT